MFIAGGGNVSKSWDVGRVWVRLARVVVIVVGLRFWRIVFCSIF